MRRLWVILFVWLVAGSARAAGDQVFWTTKDLLKDFFKSSERVTYVTLEGRGEELKAKLGYAPAKAKYVVFVATTGDKVDGYAVIDEEKGQHEPITFAVRLSPAGVVERTEIMVYREGQGGEVKEERFRRQFNGKTSADPIRVGDDLAAIAGATISSKAMAVGVRRAVALVELVKRRGPEIAGH